MRPSAKRVISPSAVQASFASGTPICTPKGVRPIETSRPGDWVSARPRGKPCRATSVQQGRLGGRARGADLRTSHWGRVHRDDRRPTVLPRRRNSRRVHRLEAAEPARAGRPPARSKHAFTCARSGSFLPTERSQYTICASSLTTPFSGSSGKCVPQSRSWDKHGFSEA